MTDDELGTVRWFGRSWGAPINSPRTEIPLPLGQPCLECGQPIDENDRGVSLPYSDGVAVTRVYYHLACWLRELGIERWTPGDAPT